MLLEGGRSALDCLAHARLAEAYAELDKIDRANEEILAANTLTSRSQLSPLDALYLDAVTDTVRRNFADAIGTYAEVVQRVPDEGRSAIYRRLWEELTSGPKSADRTSIVEILRATKRGLPEFFARASK